jgi:hypothetical protein
MVDERAGKSKKPYECYPEPSDGWIDLRPQEGVWSSEPTTALRRMLCDGQNPTFVALLFDHVLVVFKGQDIGGIIRHIERGNKVIIEEYDPNKNKHAPKSRAPVTVVVESMKFFYENITAMVTDLQKN